MTIELNLSQAEELLVLLGSTKKLSMKNSLELMLQLKEVIKHETENQQQQLDVLIKKLKTNTLVSQEIVSQLSSSLTKISEEGRKTRDKYFDEEGNVKLK